MMSKPLLFVSLVVIAAVFSLWIYLGLSRISLDADLSRDLTQLSELWQGNIVWLGPQLRVGFPASPLYFYLLFPGLLLSGGSAQSLVMSQVVMAIITFVGWLWWQRKTTFASAVVVAVCLGVAPWWLYSVTHPWNGYLYVVFVVAAVMSLWATRFFWLSMLLIGSAIAIHPAAVLVLPLFGYEWLVRKNKLFNGVVAVLGLLLPWTPIFIFEFITKGFLVRQWLAQGSTGFSLAPSFSNVLSLANSTQLPYLLLLITIAAAIYFSTTRHRWWLGILGMIVAATCLASAVHAYYLFGLLAAITFVCFSSLSKHKIGLVMLWVVLLGQLKVISLPSAALSSAASPLPARSIPVVEHTVQTIAHNHLSTNQTYALVSVIADDNPTPQADDYRFFFRVKGYQALPISSYPTADKLLVFFETGNLQWNESYWQNWEDYQTQLFGSKKLETIEWVGSTAVAIYSRD